MATNDYHFITEWRVKASPAEVFDILKDAEALVDWWPSVYLEVKRLTETDDPLETTYELWTKGYLPYTLKWSFKPTEYSFPKRIALTAYGDFKGEGVWTFNEDGEYTNIIYDWKITADKPILKKLSFMLKPLFASNHKWAMAQGLKSLEIELQRRKLKTVEERSNIPLPPLPILIPSKKKMIVQALSLFAIVFVFYKINSKKES